MEASIELSILTPLMLLLKEVDKMEEISSSNFILSCSIFSNSIILAKSAPNALDLPGGSTSETGYSRSHPLL